MDEIAVLFRWPRFPVLVAAPQLLRGVFTRKQLARVFSGAQGADSFSDVKIIDFTGYEFWFHGQQRILAPGLGALRWTKRQMIELYHKTHQDPDQRYEPGSLSKARLGDIVNEPAQLLESSDRSTGNGRSKSGRGGW